MREFTSVTSALDAYQHPIRKSCMLLSTFYSCCCHLENGFQKPNGLGPSIQPILHFEKRIKLIDSVHSFSPSSERKWFCQVQPMRLMMWPRLLGVSINRHTEIHFPALVRCWPDGCPTPHSPAHWCQAVVPFRKTGQRCRISPILPELRKTSNY